MKTYTELNTNKKAFDWNEFINTEDISDESWLSAQILSKDERTNWLRPFLKSNAITDL